MSLLNQAKAAGEIEDHTDTSGGFEYTPPPAGKTMARLIGYVEIGKQPQRAFKGVEKQPALEAILTFELNSKKHINEYEKDGVKHTRTNTVTVRVPVHKSEKSNFFKLFTAMKAGRDNIKNMAQMLGEGFLVTVTHNVVEKEGNKKTYCNLKSDTGWNIGAPVGYNSETDETAALNIPPATQPIQLLIWKRPTVEQWDSIFIDGTYTKKEGDNEVQVSKNFTQQLCMKATDFKGSALARLIGKRNQTAAPITSSDDEAIDTIDTELPLSSIHTPETSEINPPPVDQAPDGPAADDVLGELGLGQ